MEKVRYSVLFFIFVNQVFATVHVCSQFDLIKSCNECIRCGGYWCNDPNEFLQCVRPNGRKDNWCNNHQEPRPKINTVEKAGQYLSLQYREQTLVHATTDIEITYQLPNNKTTLPKVKFSVNSTQNPINVTEETYCENGKCTMTVSTGGDFCTNSGTPYEYFTIGVFVEGINEEAILKNHVPCGCLCNNNEGPSEICHGRGIFSCGTCSCEEGWAGKFCEVNSLCNGHGTYLDGRCVCTGDWDGISCEKCRSRGDVPFSQTDHDGRECFGNGYYDGCSCVCFNNTEGARYYDRSGSCADLCMTISDNCDVCIDETDCQCNLPLQQRPYEPTLMDQRDERNRHVWVHCNETKEDCTVQYAAMRNDSGEIEYMIINSCQPINNAVTGRVNVTLPIALILIALVAAGAAVAGYVYWKNRTPPLPVFEPMYHNIGTENSTCENPTYKPPTSTFKNPTYGKWWVCTQQQTAVSRFAEHASVTQHYDDVT